MARITLALAAVAVAGLAAAPATAAYQLVNLGDGGNGYVVDGPSPYWFTIIGTDNPDGCDCDSAATLASLDDLPTYSTLYYDQAAAPLTIRFRYRYQSLDSDGASYDPAGYVINDEYFQLSPDESDYLDVFIGTGSFTVQAGDYYGFWVGSTDGVEGPGVLSIGAVPEPASWALMIGGFGMIGTALRRRRSLTTA